MNPEEFAEAHGLTLEEAELILSRRRVEEVGSRVVELAGKSETGTRFLKALRALQAAQAKVGVHPVVVSELGLQRGFDEVAEENLEKFYSTKGGSKRPQGDIDPATPTYDEKWEDPP